MGTASGFLKEVKRSLNQRDLDTLILFVTNACNLSCGFCCYADNLNQARDISFDNLLRLSQTTPKFRCLLISGGEPFIRPRLDEIMLAFAQNNGVTSIAIPTNGWYTDRTLAACQGFLDKNSTTMLTISFSVDGLADRHNSIRGKPETFANLCKTIEALTPWCAKYPNLRLRVHSVVTPENVGEIRATIDHFFKNYELEEHSLEIVRDLSYLSAHHDSPERRAMADKFVELVRYSYDLYYKSGRPLRPKVGHLDAGLANLLTYAHCLANAQIKHDRMQGKLWSFPCTAGRKILVVDGSGSLRACELRGEIVDLRTVDFDMGRALATGSMVKEVDQIKKDRCDCIHGCFVGSGLQHSPKAILTEIVPQAGRYFTKPVSARPSTPPANAHTPPARRTPEPDGDR